MELISNPIITIIFEINRYFAPIVMIAFLLYFFSSEKRITDSCIFNVSIGIKTPIVVLKRS